MASKRNAAVRPDKGGSLKPGALSLYLGVNIILIGYSFYMVS
jgi:hypothetical protein